MLMRWLPVAAVVGFCSLLWWPVVRPHAPKLIYNLSPSAPIGWYRIDPKSRAERGDLVAAYAADWARDMGDERDYLPRDLPLIKTVWAVEGDEICYKSGSVAASRRPTLAVPGVDGAGRSLPALEGCQTLGEDEVFLVSIQTDASWDSRYFGAVKRSEVLGRAVYLGKGWDR